MANCKNCYHYHMCDLQYRLEEDRECKHFKDETLIDKALEKQIPYKPKEYEDKFYACKCGNCVLYKWEHYPDVLTPKEIEGLPYCLGCGQKLDWSDED